MLEGLMLEANLQVSTTCSAQPVHILTEIFTLFVKNMFLRMDSVHSDPHTICDLI